MDTLKLLSQSLRGAIIAPPGKLLFVADYASIEARVLLWMAQDEEGLNIFRNNGDLYCDMASAIFGKQIVPDKDHQPPERALGKVAVLGLGYQMGAAKFKATCDTHPDIIKAGLTVSEELAQRTVETYREKYWRVKQLWYDQETAAGEAAFGKEGIEYECYPVTWVKDGRFLYCRLPSGRKLAYPDPAIKLITTSWGARRNALTYMGVNALSRKWMRQASYGGLIVENSDQAISRDIMAAAMLRCEESRIYSPILSVHDETLCEAHKDHGNLDDYLKIVGQVPTWAPGLPVACEGFTAKRYRK